MLLIDLGRSRRVITFVTPFLQSASREFSAHPRQVNEHEIENARPVTILEPGAHPLKRRVNRPFGDNHRMFAPDDQRHSNSMSSGLQVIPCIAGFVCMNSAFQCPFVYVSNNPRVCFVYRETPVHQKEMHSKSELSVRMPNLWHYLV
jgi:hypothetical protein